MAAARSLLKVVPVIYNDRRIGRLELSLSLEDVLKKIKNIPCGMFLVIIKS